MKFEPKEFSLKDGRKVVLRTVETSEARTVLEFQKEMYGWAPFLIRGPNEVVITDDVIKSEEEWIRNKVESPNALYLCGFYGDRMISAMGIDGAGKSSKVKHRATLGISIVEGFCSAGLGAIMMQEGLEVMKQSSFSLIELGVFGKNERAIRLYKKIGFVEYGRLPKAFKQPDGTYDDEILMFKEIVR